MNLMQRYHAKVENVWLLTPTLTKLDLEITFRWRIYILGSWILIQDFNCVNDGFSERISCLTFYFMV